MLLLRCKCYCYATNVTVTLQITEMSQGKKNSLSSGCGFLNEPVGHGIILLCDGLVLLELSTYCKLNLLIESV